MSKLSQIKAFEKDLLLTGLPSTNGLKLVAALEAVEAMLSERATGFRETADRLNQQVIDRDPGMDAEAANRYAVHAQSSESALRIVQRTIMEALA